MMIPTYRVSHLAAYARWKATEGEGIGWLYDSIFTSESTEAMSRGTAFHSALEKAAEGNYSTVEGMGYTFAFTCDAEIVLPKTREIRQSKDYGGILVSGQCDGIEGKRIIDHKTVSQFDAEYHLGGWQHRFYLDIFEADRFDWHIWEVAEMKIKCQCPNAGCEEDAGLVDFCPVHGLQEYRITTKPYEVYAHHVLTQYTYPGLESDCRELAQEFRDFAARLGWSGKAA